MFSLLHAANETVDVFFKVAVQEEMSEMSHTFSLNKNKLTRTNCQTSNCVLCAVVHKVEILFSNVKATAES